MAARAAKKKRDIPPLYVITERVTRDNGSKAVALVPAFQHDDERLQSFRLGTRLVSTIEPDGSRRGVRKWFAILGKAVKASLLPWVTVSAADEAIRLALDLYEPKKANDGSWHRVTASLNDLTDEELDEQIEAMTALIVKISGVDPDDFKREMHGAGDERFASDYDRPAAANDAGSPNDLPDGSLPSPSGDSSGADQHPIPDSVGTAALNSDEATKLAMVPDADSESAGDPASTSAASAPNSAEEGSSGRKPETSVDSSGAGTSQGAGTAAPESSGEEEKAAGEGYGAVSPPAAELSEEDRKWLKEGALMMMGTKPAHDPEALTVLARAIIGIRGLQPRNVSDEAIDKMNAIGLHCLAVGKGDAELDMALVAETALSTVAEITPAPVTMGRKAQ